MLILTIRTDKPEAELGLYDDHTRLAHSAWLAHRELAETVQLKIEELLKKQGKTLPDVQGIVVFKGPGSFTGLRIGLTVANALAYAQKLPIVGALGGTWIEAGISRLLQSENDRIIVPEYGAAPHITQQKK